MDEPPQEQGAAVSERVAPRAVDDHAAQPVAVAVPPRVRAQSPVERTQAADPSAPTMEDTRAYLQASYEREPVDRAWARDAQMDLQTAIEKQMPSPPSMNHLECRTSLCRAEIAFTGPDEFRTFLNDSGLVWKGAGALIRTGSGEDWSTVAFFVKPGQPLPTLE
jgi:hypothetical protein